MILRTKGQCVKVHLPIVGRVTRDRLSRRSHEILICDDYFIEDNGYFLAVLTKINASGFFSASPYVHSVQSLSHLEEGDIIVINTDDVINTLYRRSSHHNFLLVTERCNSNCLMCSQPPKDRDDIYAINNIHRQLIPLIPKDCHELGITGGEPTLMGTLYFDLLRQIKSELPQTELHCLTNGRSFAWKNMAERLGDLNYNRLMLGIPLYSDYYQAHDYIVQAKNAFNQTITGLYNLAANNVRIEVRIVLQKQTIPRLEQLAKYIYKNLPFVEHVAFMGLENQGYTPFNIEKLWIDPIDYANKLSEAVHYLVNHGMNVSIYNSQLCILPENVWPYNKKSISDWKNIYLGECAACLLKEECGGLFASCENMHSKSIKAFKNSQLSY